MKTLLATVALIASTAAASAQMDFRGDHDSPKIYAPNGQFLGNLNNNRYDHNSVANPYGPYGSRYSGTSINNPYGPYGNGAAPTFRSPNSIFGNENSIFGR